MHNSRFRPTRLGPRILIQGLALCWALSMFGASSCGGAQYPLCQNDDGCNQDGHHGVCVAGKCVACRDDHACASGEQCMDGACTAITGFCDESHHCPGDAPCTNRRCAAPVASREPVQCDEDHPCAITGQHCQNGHCVAPPQGGPGCQDFPAPKFDYESPTLLPESMKTLERLAKCIAEGSLKNARVLLTGHCDARGEYEFNMSLGAERAEQARRFLLGAGLPADRIQTSSRGKLDASGADDAGWANDRRVDIEVR